MTWIEVDCTLPTHPKTMEAAMLLDIPEAAVVGHMVCLWTWAVDAKPNGDLDLSKPRIIAKAAQWAGEPGRFMDALLAVQFLDTDGHIHDWGEYTGRLMERRAVVREQTRVRAQRFRDRYRLPIFNRDRGHCRYCHTEVTPAKSIIDHVHPDGSGDENVVLACFACNTRKGGRSPEQAGMALLPIWGPENVTQSIALSHRDDNADNGAVTLSNAPTEPNRTQQNRTEPSPTTPEVSVAPAAPDAPPSEPSTELVPVEEPRRRASDPLWDAVKTIWPKGPKSDAERNKWNTACGQLRKYGVTPEEILTAAAHWPNVMADATMTPMALANNLGMLLEGPQVNGRSHGVTREMRQRLTQNGTLRPSASEEAAQARALRDQGKERP